MTRQRIKGLVPTSSCQDEVLELQGEVRALKEAAEAEGRKHAAQVLTKEREAAAAATALVEMSRKLESLERDLEVGS